MTYGRALLITTELVESYVNGNREHVRAELRKYPKIVTGLFVAMLMDQTTIPLTDIQHTLATTFSRKI